MKFLVIEGLDGSGKSTQVGKLRSYLDEKNISYRYLHFPRTDSPFFGELVAKFLRGEFGSLESVHPQIVAMLYAGDRFDAANTIRKWLSQGFLVLADRYVYSNIAYQCAKIDNPVQQKNLADWIYKLEFEYFSIPKPDVNIYLHVPFSFTERNLTKDRAGEDRQYLAGNRDIHEEDLDFQKRVHQAYLWQAGIQKDLVAVDCSQDNHQMLPETKVFEKLIFTLTSLSIIPAI